MALLALIPARGGSRGVPRKNVREIAGKPLIAWTIEAALSVRGIDRVVVTTDDAEIAEVSRAAGAEVPFLRPAELAADETPGIAPVFHALDALPDFDEVLLLQPTSPLRGANDIEALLALVRESNASSVVSVTEPDCHPAWMFRLGDVGDVVRVAAGAEDEQRLHCACPSRNSAIRQSRGVSMSIERSASMT